MKSIIKLLFLILIFNSCGNSPNQNSSSYKNVSSNNGYEYEDGRYCAEIEYYYSKTGTRSEYTLEVEIEDDELVKIYWSNRGWLDDSHFYPPDISDGSAEFSSDRGVEYEVEIIGKEEDCYLSRFSPSESYFISTAEEELCPRCGGSKDSYDTYCDDCTDEIENTCSRCGAHEYYVYGGLCSSCQEEEEDESFFGDDDDDDDDDEW